MAAGLEEYDPVIILPNPNNQKSAMAGNAPEQEDLSRDQIVELSTRFNIFPNPATDILSVEFITSAEACTFVIYDIQGRQIHSIERNESLGYLTIDVSDLESGNYILYSPQFGERKQFVVKR
ncbi:MAG: T9SS type A sorting domain-containing protein [Bacteroidales bacterium]